MNDMPVGPEPVLNNDPAPGTPDIAPPRSSPATVVAIVLSAMKNKRDPAIYGTSYATVMNEDIAQKAARDIADIYAALQPSSAEGK